MMALKILFIDYAGTIATLMIMTIILNVFSAEHLYMLPYYLPGVPTDSAYGFELNTIWHFWALAYCPLSYTFFDGLNAILVLHVLLLTNVLCNKIRIINEMAGDKQRSQSEIFENMKNMILLQMEMRS